MGDELFLYLSQMMENWNDGKKLLSLVEANVATLKKQSAFQTNTDG